MSDQTSSEADGKPNTETLADRFPDPGEADLSFDCPRCGKAVAERNYGPCQPCRDQLQADQLRSGDAVEAPEYEPKMNVTPNAVALKDD